MLLSLQKGFADADYQDVSFLTAEENAYLHELKEIKMCVDPNWMPFEYVNKQGVYEGILADFVYLFSQKLHIPFVLEKTEDYSQSRRFLKEGKCDIIVGEQITDEVKKLFLVTKPYFSTPRAFATHIDARLVHDFSQIAHSGKIGVLKDSPAEVLLPKIYAGIQLVSLKSSSEGLRKVASRELVAFVNTLPALVYTIQHDGLSNVKISGVFNSSVELSMLVYKKREKLVPILNKTIDTVTQQEKQTILNKWVQVKYEKGVDYTLFVRLLIAFGVILLFMWQRYYHSYKTNKKLQQLHQDLEKRMLQEVEKNRKQQLMILQQNRLAQKGEMISMISHQWRQPLNTLSLLHQTLWLKYKKGQVTEKMIEEFKQNSDLLIRQMSDTIDDFRNFFRQEKHKVEFCVASVVRHALSIVEPILKKNGIVIEVQVEENIYYTGYPNELGQAIINILNNAKDALIQQGIDEKKIMITLWRENNVIYIKICDNGGGIDEAVLPYIFDPYFSTKEERQGTGLGLYMCKMIIEDHMKGVLEVNNQNGGACFLITLK